MNKVPVGSGCKKRSFEGAENSRAVHFGRFADQVVVKIAQVDPDTFVVTCGSPFTTEDLASAQDFFNRLCAECRAVYGAPFLIQDLKRPVGISDPQDARYGLCNLFAEKLTGDSPYACYSATNTKWRRFDRKPLTKADIQFLQRPMGQTHKVCGTTGDLFATVYTECDSSD